MTAVVARRDYDDQPFGHPDQDGKPMSRDLLSAEAARGQATVTDLQETFMNRMRKTIKSNDESGFTLIELLIVIVILGILAGIAIFAVDQFQTDAKTACTNANTRITDTVSAAKKINSSGSFTTTTGNCT